MSSIVFDTTALIHFTRAGRLRELQASSTEEQAILLANVARELKQGAPLRMGLDPAAEAWLKPVELTEIAELAAFTSYKAELGGGVERNNGEAAVLAWIRVNGGIAIIDEAVARNIGQEDGLAVHGSLWLLSRSLNEGILDRATVEGVVSDLIASGMHLPCKKGTDFIAWAQSVSLIPKLDQPARDRRHVHRTQPRSPTECQAPQEGLTTDGFIRSVHRAPPAVSRNSAVRAMSIMYVSCKSPLGHENRCDLPKTGTT